MQRLSGARAWGYLVARGGPRRGLRFAGSLNRRSFFSDVLLFRGYIRSNRSGVMQVTGRRSDVAEPPLEVRNLQPEASQIEGTGIFGAGDLGLGFAARSRAMDEKSESSRTRNLAGRFGKRWWWMLMGVALFAVACGGAASGGT